MIIASVLPRITALIVRACDPERVILFGSHAKGQATIDSDIDLLVIGEFGERRGDYRHELHGLFHGFPVGVDLLLATPAEVVAQAADPVGFFSSILEQGVTLYDRQAAKKG